MSSARVRAVVVAGGLVWTGLLAGCAASGGGAADSQPHVQSRSAGSTPGAAAPARLVGIIGYRWPITEVKHGGASVTIPASSGGYVTLTADGKLGGHDGINPYSGTFIPTAQGYRVIEMAVGGVGMGRLDPVTEALVNGIRAVTEQGTEVAAALSGDRLDLIAGDYQITATRLGPEPNPTAAPPTASPS